MKILSSKTILLTIVLFSIFLTNPMVHLAETTKDPKPIDLMFNGDSPPTARQIDPFKKLKKDASIVDIVSVIGKPDEDVGSGIYVFVYNLEDETKVWIGATALNQPPMYIVHILKDGQKEYLFKK